MKHHDLIERMRSFETDHTPDGWPAIRMRDISALCDAIESLLAEVSRLTHNLQVTEQTMREYQELAEKRLEEIAKYRDAPVVAWNGGKSGREWTTDKSIADKWMRTDTQQAVPLIVNLGENK